MNCMLVVEDDPSEAVMRKLVADHGQGLTIGQVLPKRGNQLIRHNIQRFRNACHVMPHLVLTDLDQHPCAPVLLSDWNAEDLPERVLLRVAVREVESWLLADRAGVADFLGVPVTRIPLNVEELEDPKQALLNLARRSRSRRFIQEFVPAAGSAASQGPLYNAHLARFATNSWNVLVAAENSGSLQKAVFRIREFGARLMA